MRQLIGFRNPTYKNSRIKKEEMNIKQYFPILTWLPKYNADFFKGDLVAGLTVGIMLIPQGMAYAMLAGMPPIYGLYASIIPLILYAVFGTSRQLAVGPVAMISLLIAASVGELASDATEFISLTILLTMMVGVIQLLMGIFRLGFLVNFLSQPVDAVNFPTLTIGLVAIGLIILVKKIKLPIPGPLLAVVFGILTVWLLGWDAAGVKIVKEVPEGLPAFGIPSLNFENVKALLPIAITISFISFMQSISIAKSIQIKNNASKDSKSHYQIVPNQELIALGMMNIGGSFFQSLPTTGGFARTAVNVQNGAKTGVAPIISATVIALTLLFLTPLFYYLPNAILASIIMVAVYGLIDFKEAKYLWRTDRGDFLMMLATFLGTLIFGIEEGILIGVILSLALIIFRTTQPHTAVLGKIPERPHYKNIDRFKHLEVREDILIMRFDARLYFANVNFFKEKIETEIFAVTKHVHYFHNT